MRLQVVFVAAVLAGCAVEPAPDEVRQLRQAGATFPPFPQYVGPWAEARLGTSVAECRVPGFVAGAPGVNATLLATDGGSWFLDPGTSGDAGAVGVAVACDGAPAGVIAVTAGDEGAYVLAQNGARLDYRPVAALARGPSPTLPLLMGQPELGLVRAFLPTDGGSLSVFSLLGTQGLGAALEWNETGAFFAIGNPTAGQVTTYTWIDAGAVFRSQLPGATGIGFGSALAIGDVHPSSGPGDHRRCSRRLEGRHLQLEREPADGARWRLAGKHRLWHLAGDRAGARGGHHPARAVGRRPCQATASFASSATRGRRSRPPWGRAPSASAWRPRSRI